MKYRRKTEEVTAEQWFSIQQPPDGVLDVKYSHHVQKWSGRLAGNHQVVYLGEWVVTEANGERRACEHDTFEALYERVQGSEGAELG